MIIQTRPERPEPERVTVRYIFLRIPLLFRRGTLICFSRFFIDDLINIQAISIGNQECKCKTSASSSLTRLSSHLQQISTEILQAVHSLQHSMQSQDPWIMKLRPVSSSRKFTQRFGDFVYIGHFVRLLNKENCAENTHGKSPCRVCDLNSKWIIRDKSFGIPFA